MTPSAAARPVDGRSSAATRASAPTAMPAISMLYARISNPKYSAAGNRAGAAPAASAKKAERVSRHPSAPSAVAATRKNANGSARSHVNPWPNAVQACRSTEKPPGSRFSRQFVRTTSRRERRSANGGE